jgi:hypothetical protein
MLIQKPSQPIQCVAEATQIISVFKIMEMKHLHSLVLCDAIAFACLKDQSQPRHTFFGGIIPFGVFHVALVMWVA